MMNTQFTDYQVVLASASPRRRLLLAGLDIDFEVKIPQVQEQFPDSMNIEEVPVFLSELKSKAFFEQFQSSDNTLVITADTIVVLNGEIIGKPTDYENAIEILGKLSGNKHTVISGVTIATKDKKVSFSDRSEVFFKKLTSSEIQYYTERYKPFDKAGAYGIQEWIGYVAIEKIEGSFYNVMGLPTMKLWEQLRLIIQ